MFRSKKLVLLAFLLTVVALPVCATKETEEGKEGTNPQADAKQPEIAAYLGDEAITLDDVDALIRGQLADLQAKRYELRVRALEGIVAQKLLEAEAARRGISLDELFDVEIEAKAQAPTEEQIKQFYEANKTRGELNGKTQEEATEIVTGVLNNQSRVLRQNAYLDELRSAADVRVILDAPRFAVTIPEGEPSRGPETAPVTIVEFSDYQCGYCKRAYPTLEQVLSMYGDKVRLVYRDFALNFHPRAVPAALAARCAGDQDRYWDYYENLMLTPGTLEDDDLAKRASDLELDQEAFATCLESGRHDGAVQASIEEAMGLGVTGTPTFFINGRKLVGAVPLEQIKAVIDDELERISPAASTGS